MRTLEIIGQKSTRSSSVFKLRATSALVVSVVADALDYIAAPLFGFPVLGDIFDAVIVSLLYNITKSKYLQLVNMIEFIPLLRLYTSIYYFNAHVDKRN
jgi:hypothetical protein